MRHDDLFDVVPPYLEEPGSPQELLSDMISSAFLVLRRKTLSPFRDSLIGAGGTFGENIVGLGEHVRVKST